MSTIIKYGRGIWVALIGACVVGSLGLLGLRLDAATWTNTTGGAWQTANGWNPVGVPAAGADINLTANGNYTVTVDDSTGSVSNNSLTAYGTGGGPTLVIDYTNSASAFKVGPNGYFIGYGPGTASVVLSNGLLQAMPGVQGFIGAAAGATGNLSIYGGTNIYTYEFIVGISGTSGNPAIGNVLVNGGTLIATNISYGALGYNTTNDRGTLTTVSGNVMLNMLPIGQGGYGTWNIQGGSNVFVNNGGPTLGGAAGASGTLSVSGGQLTVPGTIAVGAAVGATGTVWATGGQILANALSVGNLGVGSMIMSNGTHIVLTNTTTTALQLSSNGGAVSSLKVYGGSLETANGAFMRLGDFGNADVLINGGKLISTNTNSSGNMWELSRIAYYNSIATVTVSNGEFRTASLYVGGGGTTIAATGTLTVNGGVAGVNNEGGNTGALGIGNYSNGSLGGTGVVDVAGAGVFELVNGVAVTLGLTPGGGGNFGHVGTFTAENGGTVRFVGAAPTITVNNGAFTVTNGVVEFQGVSTATLPANITYAGTNTLRLNNSTDTGDTSAMTIDTNQHFATLALVNGTSGWKGNLTVGSGGTLSLASTAASFSGLVTNNGVFTSVNSTASFSQKVVNNGAWITDPTTISFNDFTVGGSGSLSMSAGDTFIFKSNFVNQSTQSNTYNTLFGKFVFSGVSLTQQFATAGKDLGPEAGYTPGQTNNLLWGFPAGYNNNFALGTLELSNFTTVRVTDAFLSLPGDTRAALYLDSLVLGQNSWLIIDTNVTVYFSGSNNWAAVSAGYQLLGDAELHQLVPEPSALLLWTGGLSLLAWLRRRAKK